MKTANKDKQRKLLSEIMRDDENGGMYGIIRCLKCGRYHEEELTFDGYCSEDCERNKDD